MTITTTFRETVVRRTTISILATVLAAGSALAAGVDISKLPPASSKQGVTFEADIQPLFKTSCVRCHSGDRPRGGLRLDTLEHVLQGSRDQKVVVPGDSAKSPIVIAVSQLDPRSAMPPKPRARRGGPNGPNAGNPPAQNMAEGSTNGPAQPQRAMMPPPPPPLTAEQVGLVRAWIDQGAK